MQVGGMELGTEQCVRKNRGGHHSTILFSLCHTALAPSSLLSSVVTSPQQGCWEKGQRARFRGLKR